MPYCGGISVSQILAQREKLAMGQPNFVKDVTTNQQVSQQVSLISSMKLKKIYMKNDMNTFFNS